VYEQVIDAYMSGLEERVANGLPISQIHSVASFFVSRVDSAVDKLVEEKGARDLLGKIAIAKREGGVQRFLKSVATPRWKRWRRKARRASARSGRPPAPRTRRTGT